MIAKDRGKRRTEKSVERSQFIAIITHGKRSSERCGTEECRQATCGSN